MSNYQKLEILVLDDCSQDKTPDVIKQFAHQGVRFIRGDEPGDTWLAKNAAYHKLAQEASSELLLFCGVDVRVQPDTLRNLVSYMIQSRAAMLSVLPLRSNEIKPSGATLQVRYLWELALPRFFNKRPPVLSTLWLIRRSSLEKYGGLGAVKRAIVPEGFFARELAKVKQYGFIRANTEIAVFSSKNTQDQGKTALRVRYPQLHRKPEIVLALFFLEVLGFFMVPLTAALGLYYGYGIVVVMAVGALFIQLCCLVTLANTMSPKHILYSVLQGLFVVPLDIWLMLTSMYTYEFNEVYWKERNVCLPIMHVVPSLPTLPH